MENTIIITGAAGFIGFHLSRRLLAEGHSVLGIDKLNDYYEVTLKQARLSLLAEQPNFSFEKIDIADKILTAQLFERYPSVTVVHLAAQAGVRYSLTHPHSYVDSNLVGFINILEGCRNSHASHLIYASSSSVYGANTKVPFAVEDDVNAPLSLYAATKRANELMAHTYSHLYDLPTTGLRFFTVYGPWGRPDMAYFSFTKNIIEGATIKVFNDGDMRRDFTYIDDIVEGIVRLMQHIPKRLGITAPANLYNIGNNKPVNLRRFIEILEENIGKTADKEYLPMQPGDVLQTYADITPLSDLTGFQPVTKIEQGLKCFVDWYKEYYHILK